MSETKASGDNSATKDHMLTAKGLVLSFLVVSSAIPFFLMVPEATPAFAQPSISTITVGGGPIDIAYDSANERMYVTNLDDNAVSVIDTTDNWSGPLFLGTLSPLFDGYS